MAITTDAASGGIAFDSASNSTPSGYDVTNDSWTHTTGSGLTDSILIIVVTWRNSTTNTYDVSSITYGGSSSGITLIRKDGQDGDGISRNVALYYLKNPAAGNKQIVVTFSGVVFAAQCGAVTLEGVDQTNAIDVRNGQVSDSEDPVNVSVTTTVNNNWVVDVVTVRDETGSNSDPAISADGSQTERFNRSHPGSDFAITSGMATKGPNSSGSVTMEWDISVTSDKETAIAAVSLKPSTTITLYRSVGTTATALASGSGNALTISGSTATFGSALADKIGVGDVIQYDSDGNDSIDAIAFIHGRTNSQTYTVKDKDGATPTAVIGDNDWAIYRAYTSLANWEQLDENDTIDNAVEDFDQSGRLDLTSGSGFIMKVACYGDGEDTTAVTVGGWTTDADNYIKIYTPTLTSEVGTSQRHSGYVAASPSYYRMKVSSAIPDDAVITLREYMTIEGLVVRLDNTTVSDEGIRIDADNIEVTIKDCIVWTSQSADNQDGIYGDQNNNYTVNIENTIIYGFYRTGIQVQYYQSGVGNTSTWNINSCTIWNCSDEGDAEGGGIAARTHEAADTVYMNIFNTIVLDSSGSG
ncbi:MAG: hypothetical protein PVI96_14900 [Desulfobacterales bacterium]